jgi:hypothetical protein
MAGFTWECRSIRLRQGYGETGWIDGVMKTQPTNKLFSHAEHMVKGLFVDHFRLDYLKGVFFQYRNESPGNFVNESGWSASSPPPGFTIFVPQLCPFLESISDSGDGISQ